MNRFYITACILCLSLFPACVQDNDDPYKDGRIHIAAMNGPTMMGLGHLYNAASGDPDSKYTFTKEGTPDAVAAGLANKTYDAACLPANTAAIIFNTGSIDIKTAAINMLGVLYLVQKAGTPAIASLADLSGQTVYITSQGSTPDVAFRYLLAKNNVNDVRLEFETEGAVIAAGIKSADSKYDYAVLPQPAATVAATGPGAATEALHLTGEWKKFNPDSDIVTAVLVVRTAYLKNNRAAFEKFLADYRKSVEFVTDVRNLDVSAGYVVDMGIVPALPLAKTALLKCGITFIEADSMVNILSDFYQVLYGQNPRSISGKLPPEKFYYK